MRNYCRSPAVAILVRVRIVLNSSIMTCWMQCAAVSAVLKQRNDEAPSVLDTSLYLAVSSVSMQQQQHSHH